MSASLGGLLKDYRLQKNLSQLEIAFALGWKDTSRLSRIEQGRIDKPQRNLVDRICNIMELKMEEKNHVLLAGGYRPTMEEILEVRKDLHSMLHGWPYPASVRDFSWRIVDSNQEIFNYYNVPHKARMFINNELPNIFEVTFSPDFLLNKHFLDGKEGEYRKTFLTNMIHDFRYHQRNRTKEKWYIHLMKELMENELFRELWQCSNEKLVTNSNKVTNFAQKRGFNKNSPDKHLNMYMFIIPYLRDPRFEVELYTPSDLTTFKYFSQLTSQLS